MYKHFILNEEGEVNVLIVAGIHGDEIGTIKLAYDLINHFDSYSSDYSHGSYYDHIKDLYILPIANLEGMRSGVRDQVYTGNNDLNRGWDTSRYKGRQVISDLVDKVDVVIDLHSSLLCCSMFYLDIEMNSIKSIINVLESSKINYCIQSTQNDTLKRYADNKNKVALTWEQIGLDRIDYEVNDKSLFTIAYMLLPNIHKFFETSSSEIKNIPVSYCIQNKLEGVFSSTVPVGTHVTEGKIIGYISTLYGDKIENIIAPENCTIITSNYSRYLKAGSTLFLVQPDRK